MRNRRKFLAQAATGSAVVLGNSLSGKRLGLFGPCDRSWPLCAATASEGAARGDTPGEVMFYDRLDDKAVQCQTCFRSCTVMPGGRGFCRTRENRDGKYVSLVYGKPSAVQIDPIEKKPLYHMLPGTQVMSLGTAGCNFKCRHCQNWHLSQASPGDLDTQDLPPEKVVTLTLEKKLPGVCFTYNEPTVAYEYMVDTFVLAKKKGLRTLLHSNGSTKPEPLKKLLECTDAACIDLKGFTTKAYDNSSAKLEPILETLKAIKKQGKWLEVVNLVVPTINDDLEDIKKMCAWFKEALGVETPLHFTRFFPAYKLTHLPPTPVKTLENARQIAVDTGLHYVIIGNVPGHKYNSTFCPKCGKPLLTRTQFEVLANDLVDGACKSCGHKVPGIWK